MRIIKQTPGNRPRCLLSFTSSNTVETESDPTIDSVDAHGSVPLGEFERRS